MTMKNWLPAVPAASVSVLAIATTPSVYFVDFGGASTVSYPGPSVPVPVGSPPWITKFGMIRWKTVPTKKWRRTRLTNDAVVFGESFTSSRIVMSPQFVWSVTSYVFFGSSVSVGFGTWRFSGFGVLIA